MKVDGANHASLPNDLGGTDDGRDLAALAREFEALLMSEILKSLSDSMKGESDEATFGSSLDGVMWTELSSQLTSERGLGLGEAIYRQLQTEDDRGLPELDRTMIPPRTRASAARPAATPSRGGAGVEPSTVPAPAAPSPTPVAGAPPPAIVPDGPSPRVEPTAPNRFASPVEGRISSRYGLRADPFDRGRRFHRGLDLAAAEGTDVRASESGRVVFAGRQSGYGNVVVVEHLAGVRTLYAHLSQIGVSTGDTVGRGDSLGAVGSTGRATGPHLHFEVRRGAEREDPEEWL